MFFFNKDQIKLLDEKSYVRHCARIEENIYGLLNKAQVSQAMRENYYKHKDQSLNNSLFYKSKLAQINQDLLTTRESLEDLIQYEVLVRQFAPDGQEGLKPK